MKHFFFLLFTSLASASHVMAEGNHQPYKGLETRDISSLSDQDIQALQEGSGWGLALPAELNGYPGPAHVLELADELGLSDDQRRRVTLIFEEMRAEAITHGNRLIEAERRLDVAFVSANLDGDDLRRLINGAEDARAELRFVHLSRHLMTFEILDTDQIALYAVLRGYSADPCAAVPKGHDPTMWRRHNGCDEN